MLGCVITLKCDWDKHSDTLLKVTRMVFFFLFSTYTVVLDLDLLDVKVREPTLKILSDKQSGSAPWASSPWLGGGRALPRFVVGKLCPRVFPNQVIT